MKVFTTTTIAILLFAITCKAQWNPSGTNIYNSNAGNVGIGITNPTQALQIISGNTSGTFGAFASASGQGLSINPNSIAGTVNVFADYLGGTEPKLHLSTTSGRFNAGGVTIAVSGNVGIGTASPLTLHHIVVPSAKATLAGSVASFLSTNDASNPFGLRTMIYGAAAIADRYVTLQTTDYSLVDGGDLVLQPASTGNVGIGTTNPDQKLTVNGTVHSKSIVVDNNIFADYVFDKTYALRPLSAVKTYIDLNHHLPEMPSAAEVAKNGQNLGEINTLLLKKVEELTLYLIEKEKQSQEQQKVNEAFKQQLDAVTGQLNELKSLLVKTK